MFNYLFGNNILKILSLINKGYGFVIVQATPQQVLNNFSFFSLKDNLLSSISTFD